MSNHIEIKKLSSKQFIHVIDDLYLVACPQGELTNTINSIMLCNNRVAFKQESYPYDPQYAFCVIMNNNLKQEEIFNTLVYELVQYSLKKIFYKPACTVSTFPLYDVMIEYASKTLANPACFECNYFGSEKCKLHPKFIFPSGSQNNRLATWFESLFSRRHETCPQFEYNFKNFRDECAQYCFVAFNNNGVNKNEQ